jgi:caa(3)-type oxidase subunit IV
MSEHELHDDSFYVKTWVVLLVLLGVSIVGPEIGIAWVTLFTAFGIAVIKAYLVAVRFMHLDLTPRFVIYFVTTSLVFMLLFFAGTAPDVMKSSGTNWVKPQWIAAEAAYAARGAAAEESHLGMPPVAHHEEGAEDGPADEGGHH